MLNILPNSLVRKIAVFFGLILLCVYTFFRVQLINLAPSLAIFSVLLFLAELHTILLFFGLFYAIWPRKYNLYTEKNPAKDLAFNIFICVCGEPASVVRKTIQNAKAAAAFYTQQIGPDVKPRVIVLNDGFVAGKKNYLDIQNLCKSLKVESIMRQTGGEFKAGNINNALGLTKTNSPFKTIDIVLDADFAAKKEFLVEICKPFAQKSVDFVQSPQRYQNEKTWVAKASAAHQIFFFDYICPSKGHDNALFLCGTNFAVRRSALEDVGGVDTRFITEDYATSLNLHLAGKKGVYMPRVLALGMAPSTLKQYFNQQQRWAKGSFDTSFAYLKQILFGKLTLKQKFHYLLSASYYLIGLRDLILMLAPIPYLFFGISLIKANTIEFLLFIYGPLIIFNFMLYLVMFKEPIKSLVLDIVSFPVFTQALFSSVFKNKLDFIVTIKKYEKENPFRVYSFQLLVIITLLLGFIYSLVFDVTSGYGSFVNYFWTGFNITFLTLGFMLIIQENYNSVIIKLVTRFLSYCIAGFESIFPRIKLAPTMAFGLLFFVYLYVPTTQAYPNLKSLDEVKEVISPTPKTELLVPDNGIYYGYYSADLNTHPQNPDLNLMPNEKTSLAMFYQDWSSEASFNARFLRSISDQNVIPVVTWEPWDSKNKEESYQRYSPKQIVDGVHDEHIRSWAKDAADFKKPIFIRFAHEMNGNWYPWGGVGGNTPEDYKDMWIHVHDIFEQEKADNVIWVWAPNNTDEYGQTVGVLNYYPGDEYVDWVGFSGFNWGKSQKVSGKWLSFQDLAFEICQKLLSLNKPIMVAETSSVEAGGTRSKWFKDALESEIPAFSKIKAVVFYNDTFGPTNFKLLQSPEVERVLETKLKDNEYYLDNPILKTVE